MNDKNKKLNYCFKQNNNSRLIRTKYCKFTALSMLSVVFHLVGAATTNVYAYKAGNVNIDITGSVSETYDDNISSVKDNKKDDLITNAAVGIASAYENKITSFRLTGAIAQHLFAQYHNFDNTSVDFSASLTHDISKYDRIIATDTFMSAEETTSLIDAFGRTSGRYRYIHNSFSSGYSHQFSSQLAIDLKYANEAYNPSRSDLSDSYLNEFGIGANYSVVSDTALLLEYEYSHRNFNPGRGAFINALSTGLKHYFTTQLYLEAKTGIQFIESYNRKNYAKPLFIASVVNDISKNTRWSFTFEKQYSTNPYTEDIFNSWEVFPEITQQLTEKLGLFFSGFYGKGKYPALGIKDTLQGVSLGVGYDIKENIKGTLFYKYSQVDSNDSSREYARNSWNAGITAKF